MLKKDKSELTDIEYIVTQENGTEPPFMNEYWNHFAKGIYVDKREVGGSSPLRPTIICTLKTR